MAFQPHSELPALRLFTARDLSDSELSIIVNYASRKHQLQKRKYLTDVPYIHHPMEVAALTIGAQGDPESHSSSWLQAMAWLHDVIEDTGVFFNQTPVDVYNEIALFFGEELAMAVLWLTDTEPGNRRERKALARVRLARSDWYVQTVKLSDCIHNTSNICLLDPKFAKSSYLGEIHELVSNLTAGHGPLHTVALKQIQGWATILGIKLKERI